MTPTVSRNPYLRALTLSLLASITYVAIGLDAFAGAICEKDPHTQGNTLPLDFNGPGEFGIPLDLPIGAVVYSEQQHTSTTVWKCSSTYRFGAKADPAVSTTPATGSLFPIIGTGLSWRITLSNTISFLPWQEGVIPTITAGKVIQPRDNFWDLLESNTNYLLELVKTSDALPQKNKIRAGAIGSIAVENLVLKNINIKKEITFRQLSCETPAISVPMGNDYTPSSFIPTGIAPPQAFAIKLQKCPRGINKVNYKLLATTPVIDSKNGIVSLNSSSSAKGVGLKLMTDDERPVSLDTVMNFSGYNSDGGDFSIPFKAAYVRLDNQSVTPGSANTQVTFITEYL